MIRLSETAPVLLVAASALILLASVFLIDAWLKRTVTEQRIALGTLEKNETAALPSIENLASLKTLKEADLETFKQGLTEMAHSKKGLYESGLALQEEKRLLEKQWDILVTYLQLNSEAQTIAVMKGENPVVSYPVIFGIPQGYGEHIRDVPNVVKIVSKERFAHPERGKVEKSGDEIIWTPPQVGTSVRSNALGQYVMFTDSSLVLHGPPAKVEEHEAYPHSCLALPLESARGLYQKSYIGTKILIALRG